MANNKTHLKKRKDFICCICKETHNPEINVGNSVGDGQCLGDEIAGGPGKTKDYLKTHCFYRGRESRSRKNVVYSQIQAHHLVCGEAMDDKASEGEFTWEQLCNSFGYDINCKENGVNLPSCLEVACINMVPLHRGNHNATEGSNGLNYVESVKKLIEPLKENASNYCSNPKSFIDKLNSISNSIFEKIKIFKWTLTKDGKDYDRTTGCLNCTTIPQKRKIIFLSISDGIFPSCDSDKHEDKRKRVKHNLIISK
jgi:hypothetical protein